MGAWWQSGHVWLVLVNARRYRKVHAPAQLPAWERAMTAWRQLYYCGRDDIVFIPGTSGAVAPAEHMARILT